MRISVENRSLQVLLGSFVAAWVLTGFLYWLNPFQSHLGTHYALFYSYGYVLVVCTTTTGLWALQSRRGGANLAPVRVNALLVEPPRGLHWLLLGIVLVGLAFHLYDKVALRGYDYSQGITSIREQWLRDGVARHGAVSSWQSVVGHLLVYAGSPLFLLALVARRPRWELYLCAGAGYLATLVYAGSMGSRSIVMLYVVMLVAAALLRYCLRKEPFWTTMKEVSPFICGVSFMSVLYASLLFYGRVQGTSQAGGDYVESFTREAGLVRPGVPGFFEKCGATLSPAIRLVDAVAGLGPEGSDRLGRKLDNLCSASVMVVIYVTYGTKNFEAALAAPEQPGMAFFSFLIGWANKLGVLPVTPTPGRSYGRGFISLPGAIWYDMGTWGLVLGGVLHGLLMWGVSLLLRREGAMNDLAVVGFLVLSAVNLCAPIAVAPGLMAFPYIGLHLLILLLALGLGSRLVGRTYVTV